MKNKHSKTYPHLTNSKNPLSKHDASLQKNSVLYFQIGLILCLLATFALFEMRFESHILKPERVEHDNQSIEYTIDRVTVYKEKVKQEDTPLPSKKIIDKIIPKDDNFGDIENTLFTSDDTTPPPSDTSTNPDDIVIVDIPEDVPVAAVEFVPVFPGCESLTLNSERYKCLNKKLGKLVQRKFDTDIASEYGLTGTQRIYVQFKVDKTGAITEIKTRAPHPKLEEEAKKLAHKIPKMQPGKMGITPVNVIYNLPIIFQVRD